MKEIEEEAKRIIELFKKLKEPNKIKRFRMSPHNAKQCALIYCEGMIKESYNYNHIDFSRFEYWQQIKQHIQNNY